MKKKMKRGDRGIHSTTGNRNRKRLRKRRKRNRRRERPDRVVKRHGKLGELAEPKKKIGV